MGKYAHATHLHIPDKQTGKLIATALLKSSLPLVISTPYSHWMNAYLPLGVSCKDVAEFPTATAIELNCYDGEGLDVRLYTADRLAFFFESGCSDVAEREDEALEIAAQLWADDPNRPIPPQRPQSGSEDAPPPEPGFWDLAPDQQEPYVERARNSGQFKSFITQSGSEDHVADTAPFASLLPLGHHAEDLHALLAAVCQRFAGPPEDGKTALLLEKWMNGKTHSHRAEDYLAAIARFLGVRGGLWSLDAIQDKLFDKIDRRVVPIDALDEAL